MTSGTSHTSDLHGQPPLPDFRAPAEVVRVTVEGERLSLGHAVNPAFATETSLIDPLPHQRIAVYEHLLPQARLRFLLADDAGAGKTIMTGLYIREMLSRQLLRRVLIVPPAGLVGNWKREMDTLFGLPFEIVVGADAKTCNPFVGPESDLVIVSVDTLAGERMFACLQDPQVEPYDLVVFDEAHKLSADRQPDFTIRRTERYRLAEVLAGIPSDEPRWRLDWNCQHLLLLTATPHMGRDFPYYALWRLIEPEVLSTLDAFNSYPADARHRHFIRRTKEEMVRYDGTRIYPTRVAETFSFDLTQGAVSEQALYDDTTAYIQTYYNRAQILNRSAARLAMSMFQRRLASSTWALLRSFERRIKKLDDLIDDVRSGKLTPAQLAALQRRLGDMHDPRDDKTADEEESVDGREEGEAFDDKLAGVVVATSLKELEVERTEVQGLLDLARKVHDRGEDSKFDKLLGLLRSPRFADEKLLVFTEHRDTLNFLVRRLEALGYTDQVATIHGGLDFNERQDQIDTFSKPVSQGGAQFMVCTDAAAEGVNLQFCWLLVNYDIPWNPARLEQRMGRIHRYGQKKDTVLVANLIAGKTREGRVLQTLLRKLEDIRKELASDKVFDVVGRLFEGVSLREYMECAITEEGANQAVVQVAGKLTKEQVTALTERDRKLSDGGDVKARLPALRAQVVRDDFRALLPGYVRRFVEKGAPLVDIGIEGNLDGVFSFTSARPYALDFLLPVLEAYPETRRNRLSVKRPADGADAVFLRPGEAVFDRLRTYVCGRFAADALRGGVFIDPYAARPYSLHIARVSIVRRADPALLPYRRGEVLDCRLVAVRVEDGVEPTPCPVEHLLVLRGGDGRPTPHAAQSAAERAAGLADAFVRERIVGPLVEDRRAALRGDLPAREAFVVRGYKYQEAELTAARSRLAEKVLAGDARSKSELDRVKDRQRALAGRRQAALAVLQREPDLVQVGEIVFVAHALVLPSTDPEDRKRHDADVEAIAVTIVCAHETGDGREVHDVSRPEGARVMGLAEYPGFDLLSRHASGEERAIEVKGRAGTGDVEMTENEWAKACTLRDRYWLYVVFECAGPSPRLVRVRDPFGKLVMRSKGSVVLGHRDVTDAGESA